MEICDLYELDYSLLEDIISNNEKVLITAPDGLKKLYKCIHDRLKNYRGRIYFSASPSYGACDLPISEIYSIDPDIVIHIGHNEYPLNSYKLDYEVIYIPAFYTRKPTYHELELIAEKLLRNSISSIGLASSIQHVKMLDHIKRYLEERGLKAIIGTPSYPQMLRGQILGCEYSSLISISRMIDAVLIVSGGYFHALGASLTLNKQTYIYDPYRGTIEDYTEKARRILAKRYFLIERIRNSLYHSVGLIIGSTPGQYRPNLLKTLYVKSVEEGYEPYIISSLHVDRDRLISIDNAFNLDFYVVLSCPRLPIDDLGDFYKPVITPGEYMMVLSSRYEKYVFPW